MIFSIFKRKIKVAMNKVIWLFLLSFIVPIFSQWSTSPDSNLVVSTWGMSPLTCTDGNGGVYILWYENDFYTYQYLQWVDRYGYVRWESPLAIKGELNGTAFYRRDLSKDGFGGALVAFTEWEVDNDTTQNHWRLRVRVSRVDSVGNFVWDSLGVPVSLIDTMQSLPQVVTDGEGGAFVSFGVIYNLLQWNERRELRLQHISAQGERVWCDEGILVTDRIHVNITHILIPDGQGGIIIEWYGDDTGFKRFDHDGNLLWHTPSPDPIYLYYKRMKPDQMGGAILSGTKYLGAFRNIIANRISEDGIFLWGDEGIVVDDSLGDFSNVQGMVFRPDCSTVIYYQDHTWGSNEYEALLQMISDTGSIILDEPVSPSLILEDSISAAKMILSDSNSVICFFYNRREDRDMPVYAQKLDDSLHIEWDTTDVLFGYKTGPTKSDKNGGAIMVWDEAPLYGIFAQQISRNGNLGEVLLSVDPIYDLAYPDEFVLFQNYPNPFNITTVISYQVPESGAVELTVYNLLGERINTLVRKVLEPGKYHTAWHGDEQSGNYVSCGIYFYQLKTKDFHEVKKLILLK